MAFTKREVASKDGGKFLRLKDGESVTGVFRGESHEFYIKWIGGKSEVSNPLDPEASLRFKHNFIMNEAGILVAKIWEFSVTVNNQLAVLSEDYPIDETKVKITRQGSGTDTTYHILPLREAITPQQMKQIEALTLHSFAAKKPEAAKSYAPGSNDEDSVPF